MTRVGYARLGTTDQDLDVQIARLKSAGCEIIRAEMGAGVSPTGCTELETTLQVLRADDELVVPEIETASSMGPMLIPLLGMVANMELKVVKDRQRAGIEAARAVGVYKGRKKSVDDGEIRRRVAAGASKASVARELNVSRMTVYRALDTIPSKIDRDAGKRPSAMREKITAAKGSCFGSSSF